MNTMKTAEVILICLLFQYEEIYTWFNNNIFSLETKNYGSENSVISPYVAIMTKVDNKTGILCGGTLISRKYILTAAHCLEGAEVTTIIMNLSNLTTETKQLVLHSNKIKIHENWLPNILLNDIALIEIDRTQYEINRVNLFTKVRLKNSRGILYGWESNSNDVEVSPILRTHLVDVIKNEECAKDFGTLIQRTNICTKASKFGNGCHGFSGGPLVVDGTQIGVVSFGTTNCDSEYPTIHTRVSKYKKWIKANSDIKS